MGKIKRFLVAALSMASLAIGALGFSACEFPSGAHFHNYGEGEITQEATCGQAGVKTFTCNCGDSYTEEIPALAHEIKQAQAQESTCVTPGWNAYEYCENCDYTTKEELPLGGHTEIEHEAQESTCSVQGWNAYVSCQYCDYNTKELLPLADHAEVQNEAQESTCTVQGWNAYVTCENCDYSTKELLPLAEHAEVSHEAQESTCTVQGWNAYVTCENCDYSTKELLPLADHAEVQNGAQESTCTVQGWNAYVTCENCDYSTKELLPLADHAEVQNGAQESTCTVQGWNAYVTCENCDYSTKELLPLADHAFADGICGVCAAKDPEYTASIGLLYELNTDGTTYTVAGLGECTDSDIVIPATYQGGAVTAIKKNAFKAQTITSVTIPDSVTTIGEGAFYNCSNLKKAVLPNTLQVINKETFYSCANLSQITIPESVKGIGDSAFYACNSLISIESYARYIEDNAFDSCGSLRTVKLYDVAQVGYCAFNYCRRLQEVYLSGNLHTVEQWAFAQTASATIFCSLAAAQGGWDSSWNYLGSGRVIWNVKEVGETEDKYTYATLNDNTVMLIGYHGEDTELILPKTVGEYPVTALRMYDITASLDSITAVVIPETVTSIAAEDLDSAYQATFYYEGTLENITWDKKGSPIVENYAGEKGETDGWSWAKTKDGTLSLTGSVYEETLALSIPEKLNGISVTAIAAYAFRGYHTLEVLYLPNGIAYVGEKAISSSQSLKSVFVPDTVLKMGENPFTNLSLATLYCEASEQPSGWAGDWSGKTVVWGVSAYGETDEGLIWAKTGETTACIVGYLGTETVLSIPETIDNFTVTEIIKYAFKGQTALSELAIPECVTTIGVCAIDDCSALTVYAYASEQPAGWANGTTTRNWNPDSRPVVYGYGGAKGNENGVQWVQMAENRISIIGYTGSDGNVVIPEKINGSTVTEIANKAFENNQTITSVQLPQGLVKIGERAFYGCCNIEEITIPSSVETIGSYAFASNLSSNYPTNKLKTVTFAENCKVTKTSNSMFYGCRALKTVTLSEGILTISGYTFYECYNLQTVVIPQSLQKIQYNAFWDCGKLESLYLPNVSDIEDSFDRCEKLTLYCGKYGTDTLDAVPIVWSCVSYGKTDDGFTYAITKDGQAIITSYLGNLTEIVIPAFIEGKQVTKIANAAFYEEYSLKKVTIPASVWAISANAFYGCKNTIYAEAAAKPSNWVSTTTTYHWNPNSRPVEWACNNVTTNADYDYVVHNGKAFLTKYKGRGVAQFILPSTIDGYAVVTIGEIFRAKTQFKYVEIPDSVTHIFPYAFYECTNIKGTYMSSSVTNIGVYAFNKTGGTFCCEAESQPKGWDGSWNYNNPAYTIVFSCQAGGVTEDGVLWYQTNDEVHLYGYMGTGTQLILPSSIGGASVKYIEANAFKGATSLTKVVISRSVKVIKEYAFYNCTKLVEVYIPSSVETISRSGNVFYNCAKATIYCEAAEKPSGWVSNWLPYEEDVTGLVWGYDMSEIYGA